MLLRTTTVASYCIACNEYKRFTVTLECYCNIRGWICDCCKLIQQCTECGYKKKRGT